jgi:ferredoxin
MKVTVDWMRCDGNGVCAAEAPEVFDLDADDNLVVLVEEPPAELRPKLEAAAASCPKRAIIIDRSGSRRGIRRAEPDWSIEG